MTHLFRVSTRAVFALLALSATLGFAAQASARPTVELAAATDFRLDGAIAEEQVGRSVAGAGDFNGDGQDDVIVATPRSASGYLLYGRTAADAAQLDLADTNGPSNGTGVDPNDGFRIDGGVYSVAGAGDVNGDGLDDLALGLGAADNNQRSDSGSAVVLYGRAAPPAGPLDLDDTNGAGSGSGVNAADGFRVDGARGGDQAGSAVAGAGDVNDDGRDDLILGAPFAARAVHGGQSAGAAYVVYGRATSPGGPVDLADTNGAAAGDGVDPSHGLAIKGAAQFDFAGTSVAGAGDVNDDGTDDVIVGAYQADHDTARTDSGSAYVIYGSSAARSGPVDLADTNGNADGAGVAQTDGLQIDGAASGDWLNSVDGAGDINVDGVDDVVLGAPAADNNNRSGSGSAYVIYGGVQRPPGPIDLAATSGGAPGSGVDPGDGFRVDGPPAGGDTADAGASVAGTGDVNGDSYDDLVIGVPQDRKSFEKAGSAYVIYGRVTARQVPLDLDDTNGPAAAGTGVAEADGFRIGGAAPGDRAGSSVAGMGDSDGDGRRDVLVGAPRASNRRAFSGSAYVVYGLGGTANAPPVAVDDATSVSRNSGANAVLVLANDTDPDGGPKRVLAASDPAHGSTAVVKGLPDRVTYTPDPGYCNSTGGAPPDTFTYTLNRGSTATVSVTVNCGPFIGFVQAGAFNDGTTARFEASVFPNGAQTTLHFDYGTTSSYDQATPPQTIAPDADQGPYMATVTGLAPSTTYHYRAVAESTSGTDRSPDMTFTTPAPLASGGGGDGGGGCCAGQPLGPGVFGSFTPLPSGPSAPSAGAASAALSAALAPAGRGARIGAILKAGAYSGKFAAPGAGRVAVVWYLVPNGAKLSAKPKPVLVAVGSATATRRGGTTLRIKLTGKGKALLKKAKKGKKKVKLVAKGSFAMPGGAKVSKKRAITLKP